MKTETTTCNGKCEFCDCKRITESTHERKRTDKINPQK